MSTTLAYRFDPISGTFTLQPMGTVEASPLGADWGPDDPVAAEYYSKFGPPPRGTTKYEMILALKDDAERQFWDLVRLGQYQEAESLAEGSPWLGPQYADYARRAFKQQLEETRRERYQRQLTAWANDPYIQLALQVMGLDPRQAFADPTLKRKVQALAFEEAESRYQDFVTGGAASPGGREWVERRQRGWVAEKVALRHGEGAVFPKPPSKAPGTQVVKDPATGVAYEVQPWATPVAYERDPETGYVVPVYKRGPAKRVGQSSQWEDFYWWRTPDVTAWPDVSRPLK